MKAVYLLFFAVLFLSVFLTSAQILYAQQQAIGEPGNSQSQSANYIFDHGTTWVSAPHSSGSGGGGSGGSGGGGGGSGGGISPISEGRGNSGGVDTILIQENGIGGVSPAVDTADSAVIAKEISRATGFAVRQSSAPIAIKKVIESANPIPQIIRIVDENNVVRALAIVLMKRVIPWPWWIAFACIVMGIILFFVALRQKFMTYPILPERVEAGEVVNVFDVYKKIGRLLWAGGGLIVAGIALFIITRFIYQVDFKKFDIHQTTTAQQVFIAEASAAIKNSMRALPIGVHRLSVINAYGQEEMKITILVKPILAI